MCYERNICLKLTGINLLVHLILLYTVTTLSYTLWPIDAPNKVVGILIFLNVLMGIL